MLHYYCTQELLLIYVLLFANIGRNTTTESITPFSDFDGAQKRLETTFLQLRTYVNYLHSNSLL